MVMGMVKCKACGREFASTNTKDEICYPCENALKRLNGYAVSRGVHEQVRWERDIALEQLADYGLSLGERADVVKVVRCKDCKYFKPAYFKADDGTETPWDETFSFDDRSDGIHYGARCKHERNTAYGLKDMAFRNADDFCSYGERKDNDST